MRRLFPIVVWIAFTAGPAGRTNAQAPEERPSAAPAIVARANEIVANPNRFLGRRVRIEDATIDAVLTPRATLLTVAGEFGRTLAVAVPYPSSEASFTPGLPVVVTGRVWLTTRELLVAWPTLTSAWDVLAQREGDPVVVADSLRALDGSDLTAPPPIVRSIERIVASRDAAALVDRQVELPAVVVRRVFTARSFEARDVGGHSVLVEVSGEVPPLLVIGDYVTVKGVITMQSTVIYPWSLLPAPGAAFGGPLLYVVASDVHLTTATPAH